MDLILLIAFLTVFIGAVAVLILSFSFPILRGAPFAGTNKKREAVMMELLGARLGGRTGIKTIDLGSGDGRLVIALAKRGYESTGIEINPLLVAYSGYKVKRLGSADRIKIMKADLWNLNLSGYDVVVLFGITYMMEKLEKKLLAELKPGAIVASNFFRFPNWKPTEQKDGVLIYIK